MPDNDPTSALENQLPRTFSHLVKKWAELTILQKSGLGLLITVLVLAAGLAISSAKSTGDYKILYANLSDSDAAAVLSSLQQSNIPYSLANGGRSIMVPSSNLYETRLKLAGQGLPKSGYVGFEILEQQKFGTSQFVERVNYQRALEGELAKSIASLDQVSSARVHLAMPRQSAFVREREKPSASVVIHIHPGRFIENGQISAITKLVASAVPGMEARDVVVVNAEGAVLGQSTDKVAGVSSLQRHHTNEVESLLSRRLIEIIEPVAGKSKVRAQVSVQLDFDERERSSETFSKNPNPEEQSKRSEQLLESKGESGKVGGIPGALTNQPPDPPEAPIVNEVQGKTDGSTDSDKTKAAESKNFLRAPGDVETGVRVNDQTGQQKSEKTVNYELDRVLQKVKESQGKIIRISASVVLDDKVILSPSGEKSFSSYTSLELAKIESLAKNALGISSERGDTLTVANIPFSPELPAPINILTPELILDLIRYGLWFLAFITFYLLVIRPLLKNGLTRKIEPSLVVDLPQEPVPPPKLSSMEELKRKISEQEENWRLKKESELAEERLKSLDDEYNRKKNESADFYFKERYDNLLSYVKDFSDKSPRDTAVLLKSWLHQAGSQVSGESEDTIK